MRKCVLGNGLEMKVLIIGKKMHYNLEHYMFNAFKRLHVEASFIGYEDVMNFRGLDFLRMVSTRSYAIRSAFTPFWLRGVNEVYLRTIDAYRPDLIVSLKGESVLPSTIGRAKKEFGVKTCLWSPDDPRFFNSLTRHIAPHYDKIYTYSKRALRLYEGIGISSIARLPFGCDPEIHGGKDSRQERRGRVLFAGTFSYKRYIFLRELAKRGIPLDIVGPHWHLYLRKFVVSNGVYGRQLSELFREYAVCLNIHQDIGYGPNMRTFEVTGSGGFLLTDRAEDIGEFFQDGREIETYDGVDDAAEKIQMALAGELDIEAYSRRAYERCHSEHTYDSRIREIIAHLK